MRTKQLIIKALDEIYLDVVKAALIIQIARENSKE